MQEACQYTPSMPDGEIILSARYRGVNANHQAIVSEKAFPTILR